MRTVKNFRMKEALVTGKVSPNKSRRTLTPGLDVRPNSSRHYQFSAPVQEVYNTLGCKKNYSPERSHTQETTSITEHANEVLSAICLEADRTGKTSNVTSHVGSLSEKGLFLGTSINDLSSPSSPVKFRNRKSTLENISQDASPTRKNLNTKPSFSSLYFDNQVAQKKTLTRQWSAEGYEPLVKFQRTYSTKSVEMKKFIINKRKGTRIYDDSSSPTRKENDSPDSRTSSYSPTRKATVPTFTMKMSKVDKILKEVKEKMILSPPSQIDINNIQNNNNNNPNERPSSSIPSFDIRRKSSLKKKVEPEEPKIPLVVEEEDPSEKLKFKDIARKLDGFRKFYSNQLVDLKRVKFPTNIPKEGGDTKKVLILRKKNPKLNQSDSPEVIRKRREIRARFFRAVKDVVRKLVFLNMTVNEVVAHKPFPCSPYERQGSKEFMENVKKGKYEEMCQALEKNPYFVHDFDFGRQTCLHWAAKRGLTNILKTLLEKGADPNATDLSGRTPLFLAARGTFLNCVKLLLYYGSNPLTKSSAEKQAIDYTSDFYIRLLLEKGAQMHRQLRSHSAFKFKEAWNATNKRDFEIKEANN